MLKSAHLSRLVRPSGRMRRGRSRPQMKLSVLLSDDEGERFCVYCAEKGHKKSTLIARLIREHLDREAFSTQRSLFPQRESAMPKERPERKTKS